MIYEKPSSVQLKKYADLVIEVGVNLQNDQELVIKADVHDAFFCHILAKSAYEHGCKKVSMIWSDEFLSHLRMQNETQETICQIEDFVVAQRNYALDKNAAYIGIISQDPELLNDIPSDYLANYSKANSLAFAHFYDEIGKNGIRWNLIAIPSLNWAKKISPDLSDEQAINKLWYLIFKAMRLDCENPSAEWKKHQQNLKNRSEILNSYQFTELHYKNSLGTDLHVGLPQNYIFQGCGEEAMDGVVFTANMPSEEIFSAPHKERVNGKVVASLPLFYNCTKIENFGFEFENGKVVNFWAQTGYDVLKNLLKTDNGSSFLGEVALVQYDSPIRNLETLFYETLFDENASCHLALGDAYPSCVQNGTEMTKEELAKCGLNSSIEHVDFMIGTQDLDIDGIKADGSVVPVFRAGKFCF